MNGIHDLGGMQGFGPIEREENEKVCSQPTISYFKLHWIRLSSNGLVAQSELVVMELSFLSQYFCSTTS